MRYWITQSIWVLVGLYYLTRTYQVYGILGVVGCIVVSFVALKAFLMYLDWSYDRKK